MPAAIISRAVVEDGQELVRLPPPSISFNFLDVIVAKYVVLLLKYHRMTFLRSMNDTSKQNVIKKRKRPQNFG